MWIQNNWQCYLNDEWLYHDIRIVISRIECWSIFFKASNHSDWPVPSKTESIMLNSIRNKILSNTKYWNLGNISLLHNPISTLIQCSLLSHIQSRIIQVNNKKNTVERNFFQLRKHSRFNWFDDIGHGSLWVPNMSISCFILIIYE